MTIDERRRSLVDQLREERPLDAAAARAAVRAVGLMNDAHARSGMDTRRDLAEAVGVSEGRISQLLNGDGNVRVSTLARVLKASGFDLELGLAGVPDEPRTTSRRPRRRASTDEDPTYITVRTETAVSEGPEGPSVEQHRTVELSSRHPHHETLESAVEWTGVVAPVGSKGELGIRYVDQGTASPGRARDARSDVHA